MNIYDEVIEIIEKRTKIGTMSRDYGQIVDDVLHIDDSYELTILEKALYRAKKEHELLDFMREREFLTNLSGVLMGELQPINIDERMSYLGTIIDKLEEELK